VINHVKCYLDIGLEDNIVVFCQHRVGSLFDPGVLHEVLVARIVPCLVVFDFNLRDGKRCFIVAHLCPHLFTLFLNGGVVGIEESDVAELSDAFKDAVNKLNVH